MKRLFSTLLNDPMSFEPMYDRIKSFKYNKLQMSDLINKQFLSDLKYVELNPVTYNIESISLGFKNINQEMKKQHVRNYIDMFTPRIDIHMIDNSIENLKTMCLDDPTLAIQSYFTHHNPSYINKMENYQQCYIINPLQNQIIDKIKSEHILYNMENINYAKSLTDMIKYKISMCNHTDELTKKNKNNIQQLCKLYNDKLQYNIKN